MAEETWTITAQPSDWLYISAYQGHSFNGRSERFGVTLRDASLLPEEVANEAFVNRHGHVPLKSFIRPIVEHEMGWQHLEAELRRMEVSNRAPDDVFDGHPLEITFSMYAVQPRVGSNYTSPLVILPVHAIRILAAEAGPASEGASDDR